MPSIFPAANIDRALARPIVATGDYTGGAAEDLFTATAHGLATGGRVYLVYESAAGVVTGGALDTYGVVRLDADTFQLTDSAGTVIENSADGTAVFLNVSQ